MKKLTNKTSVGLLAFAFVAIGTYNSVMVNSDSFMDRQDVRFVKRLDEVYGVVTTGRKLANQGEWTKLGSVTLPQTKFVSSVKMAAPVRESAPETIASNEIAPNAAIKEDLNLQVEQAFNAKLSKAVLDEISGSLKAQDGVIQELTISLPGAPNAVEIKNPSEMVGNVFEIDQADGSKASGMIYKADNEGSYIVTITTGTLEGTRLKFGGEKAEEIGNTSAAVAENNYADESQAQAEDAPAFASIENDNGTTTEVGQFGAAPQQSEEVVAEAPTEASPEQAEALQAQAQNSENIPGLDANNGFSFQPATSL